MKKHFTLALAFALVLGAFPLAAGAAEMDCGTVYCFSQEDFSQELPLTGICITSLPQEMEGALTLGSRFLRPGDVLTAQQLSAMTFQARRSEKDETLEVGYLPIYEGRVGKETVMTLSIRGKEDKAPVAEDFAVETYKNLPITAPLKVTDPEGEAMTYTLVRQSKRGNVVFNPDGTFTYTPKKNKVGVDSFVYTATDPAGKVSREATVTVTILKVSDAAQYQDTQGKACRFAAEWMKNTGIFVGESLDGTHCFQPDRVVTRGEFTAMLVKALDLMEDEEVDFTGYTDEIPQWLRPYVAAAVRSGLTAGLPDQQTFGANEPITGAEAAVMLQNALDLTVPSAVSREEAVPAWAADSVQALEVLGLALSEAPLTRGDCAQLLYQASRLTTAQPEYRALG